MKNRTPSYHQTPLSLIRRGAGGEVAFKLALHEYISQPSMKIIPLLFHSGRGNPAPTPPLPIFKLVSHERLYTTCL